MPALTELVCGDDPAAWMRLGFGVEEGALVRLGSVVVRLDGAGGGLRRWVLAGDGGGGPDALDGIPTSWAAPGGGGAGTGRRPAGTNAGGAPGHPNGATGLDHVVVLTDDRDRTAAALVDAGGDERRRTGPPAVPVAMAFVRLGPAVVEVAEGGGPPRLWGLVAVVEDLDGLAARLGAPLLGAARDAVQPGRRIATVRAAAGLGTPLAFMSPRSR